MPKRIPVTDAELAKEHRRRHIPGSAVDAITNPALRTCLAVLAGIRKRDEHPMSDEPIDNKKRAAGDKE